MKAHCYEKTRKMEGSQGLCGAAFGAQCVEFQILKGWRLQRQFTSDAVEENIRMVLEASEESVESE